jgi:hypothetical protein
MILCILLKNINASYFYWEIQKTNDNSQENSLKCWHHNTAVIHFHTCYSWRKLRTISNTPYSNLFQRDTHLNSSLHTWFGSLIVVKGSLYSHNVFYISWKSKFEFIGLFYVQDNTQKTNMFRPYLWEFYRFIGLLSTFMHIMILLGFLLKRRWILRVVGLGQYGLSNFLIPRVFNILASSLPSKLETPYPPTDGCVIYI